MKLSAGECILKSVLHSVAETERHLIILTSLVMCFERYPL